MASYVPYDSDPAIPAPYNFPGVIIQNFRLASNLVQQQILVDKYLNIGDVAGRGFYYQAFLPFVDMDFLFYPVMSYGLPPLSNFGSISQSELYFKIYVIKFVLVADLFWLPVPAIMSFLPYLFVDNSWSMIAGREVLGFPKLLATFSGAAQPAGQLRPLPLSASTFGFSTIGPGAQGALLPFVTIDPAGPGSPGNMQISDIWNNSLTGLGAIIDPLLANAVDEALSLDPSLLRTVQLKQIRAAGSSSDAAYQGIVEGAFNATNFQILTPQFAQIQLTNYITLSIASNLGLGAATPIYPISQYAATCDMTFSQDEAVYQYA